MPGSARAADAIGRGTWWRRPQLPTGTMLVSASDGEVGAKSARADGGTTWKPCIQTGGARGQWQVALVGVNQMEKERRREKRRKVQRTTHVLNDGSCTVLLNTEEGQGKTEVETPGHQKTSHLPPLQRSPTRQWSRNTAELPAAICPPNRRRRSRGQQATRKTQRQPASIHRRV